MPGNDDRNDGLDALGRKPVVQREGAEVTDRDDNLVEHESRDPTRKTNPYERVYTVNTLLVNQGLEIGSESDSSSSESCSRIDKNNLMMQNAIGFPTEGK